MTTWKAMLVGLKQVDAVNACLHLIKTDNICIVQSPQVLNPGGGSGDARKSKLRKTRNAAAPMPPPYLP